MVFKKDMYIAKVQRQGYTDDSGYKKSGYSDTGKIYAGHLKALTIKDGIEISNFGKEFQFNTISTAEIKEWDRLVIGEENYDVKGMSTFGGVTFSRRMIILQKQ